MKVKKIAILLSTIISISLLAGCGSTDKEEAKTTGNETKTTETETKTTETTEQSSDTAQVYKDGTYKAEYDKYDERGWKPFVEVKIEGDKITAVTFDYLTEDGKKKSEDADYKSSMEPVTKTYPEKFEKELQQQLMDKQDVSKVDAVTGATGSSNDFLTLAKYALDEMAKKGDTTTAEIPAAK